VEMLSGQKSANTSHTASNLRTTKTYKTLAQGSLSTGKACLVSPLI
jgi:hypothetical protein